jgi:hypothetical protein
LFKSERKNGRNEERRLKIEGRKEEEIRRK